MRVFIQRVTNASVTIEGKQHASIGIGLVVLLGIEETDTHSDIDWLVHKIVNLRIFGDDQGKMNLSVKDISGEVLIISQFTLFAQTKKGNRPSFLRSAQPVTAVPLYEMFLKQFTLALPDSVYSGVFGADMQVQLINNGPVSIWMDSKNPE